MQGYMFSSQDQRADICNRLTKPCDVAKKRSVLIGLCQQHCINNILLHPNVVKNDITGGNRLPENQAEPSEIFSA